MSKSSFLKHLIQLLGKPQAHGYQQAFGNPYYCSYWHTSHYATIIQYCVKVAGAVLGTK